MKKTEINYYRKNDYRNKRNADFKELHRSYVELQNNLKALEEKVKKMSQKSIKNFLNEIYSKSPKKEICKKQNRCLSH